MARFPRRQQDNSSKVIPPSWDPSGTATAENLIGRVSLNLESTSEEVSTVLRSPCCLVVFHSSRSKILVRDLIRPQFIAHTRKFYHYMNSKLVPICCTKSSQPIYVYNIDLEMRTRDLAWASESTSCISQFSSQCPCHYCETRKHP